MKQYPYNLYKHVNQSFFNYKKGKKKKENKRERKKPRNKGLNLRKNRGEKY